MPQAKTLFKPKQWKTLIFYGKTKKKKKKKKKASSKERFIKFLRCIYFQWIHAIQPSVDPCYPHRDTPEDRCSFILAGCCECLNTIPPPGGKNGGSDGGGSSVWFRESLGIPYQEGPFLRKNTQTFIQFK